MEIPPDLSAARRSVFAVPQEDHISHLGGISPLNWQKKPSDRAVGTDHVNLDCRGMALFPVDCVDWLLEKEADVPVNVFEASTGLFPMITGR